MGFHLDFFFDLYKLGDRFFGVFTRSKCLVATQVCIFDVPL